MADYYPFDPNPRTPDPLPPPGTIDSQFHVLGDAAVYPPRPQAVYRMPTATIDAALRMHAALGIRRGVIVQATTYGEAHEVVLDGLAAAGSGYRGCANAIVLNEASDAYLAKLDAAGIRGARFTRAGLGAALSSAEFDRAIARVRELGWYVKIQPEANGLVDSPPAFRDLEVPVLLDHFGRADPSRGEDDPNRALVLELLGRGNYWVMLSLGEKVSRRGPPHDDLIPLARAFIEAAPDRCVWGSDWPHPVSTKPVPNDADVLELFYRYTADAAERRRILVDNPARLFGFDAAE